MADRRSYRTDRPPTLKREAAATFGALVERLGISTRSDSESSGDLSIFNTDVLVCQADTVAVSHKVVRETHLNLAHEQPTCTESTKKSAKKYSERLYHCQHTLIESSKSCAHCSGIMDTAGHSPINESSDAAIGYEPAPSTSSITSVNRNFVYENGRRYHSYDAIKQLFPNDEADLDQLRHTNFVEILGGRLQLAPVQTPNNILDIGTGTGLWAIQMADMHTQADVLGVDLSPIQPTWVPPNCRFQTCDIEENWTFQHQFDFIYARAITCSLLNPRAIFEYALQHLAPGGWFEIHEIYPWCPDHDSTSDAYSQWRRFWADGLRAQGRHPDLVQKLPAMLADAGFVSIETMEYDFNSGEVASESWLARHADYNLESLEGMSLRPLIAGLGWSTERVQVLLAHVRISMQSSRERALWPL